MMLLSDTRKSFLQCGNWEGGCVKKVVIAGASLVTCWAKFLDLAPGVDKISLVFHRKGTFCVLGSSSRRL